MWIMEHLNVKTLDITFEYTQILCAAKSEHKFIVTDGLIIRVICLGQPICEHTIIALSRVEVSTLKIRKNVKKIVNALISFKNCDF